ncbi:MAG: hypothetical protein HY927_03075 [Elusimicrobia bacterium]|nr:hypothetical protein [Elusimicrobiota bacterium]
MFDVFGVKSGGPEPAPSPKSPAARVPVVAASQPGTRPPGSRPFGSQSLWMGLLVADSLLIAIFGSYVGAKVYMHWSRKAEAQPVVRHKPAKTEAAKSAEAPPPPAKTETPKTTEAAPLKAKPETPKAPETAKKPAEASKAKTPEPAKAKPAETPKAKPPQPPVEDDADKPKVKAVPVDFSLHAPDAKRVELIGAFIVRGGGRKEMVRGSDGTWTMTLFLTPNTYRYFFHVDGKKTVDPANSKIERGASVLVVYPK